jgi:serine/threonine protein kinase
MRLMLNSSINSKLGQLPESAIQFTVHFYMVPERGGFAERALRLQERFVHRDVTSGNVLLADDSHVRLADFGLVQRLSTPEAVMVAAPIEADSILMGTYGYVAPEYATAGEFSFQLMMSYVA